MLVANDAWTSLNALAFDSARAGHTKRIQIVQRCLHEMNKRLPKLSTVQMSTAHWWYSTNTSIFQVSHQHLCTSDLHCKTA